MLKGVRLAGHPDTESCRRSATPTPSTPESRDLGAGAPVRCSLASTRRGHWQLLLDEQEQTPEHISQASLTVHSIESWRLLDALLREDGPSTAGGFWAWSTKSPSSLGPA